MSSSNPPQEGTDTDKTPTPTPSAPPKPFSMSLSSNGTTKKPTSFTLKSSSSATTAEPQPRRRGGQPHQHLNHHDSDSDPENDDPTHEAVTGFDTQTGTAISADSAGRSKAKELVIPVASGNNWRDRPGVNVNVHGRRRGKKNLLPKEVQAIREAREKGVDVEGGGEEEEGEGKLKFGITYAEKSVGVDGEEKEMEVKDANAGPIVPPVIDERRPLTQDEIALRELVKESKGESEGRTDLVIQSKPTDEEEEAGDEGEGEEGGRYDETSSFRADIASRPESSSLDQYNTIPVEEFGAALLRGMGWKEGQAVGRGNYDTSATANRSITAPRIPERRPGFLGIGAKDLSGGKGAESEIGAWGKAAMRKGARKGGKEGGDGNTEGVYMPVMMRNRQTGEYITEEELATARKEVKGRKKDDDEWKERRDRNLERSGRDRGDREYRKRDYENGDDYDRSSRRTGSSRRDRSLSPGDRSSRRRRYDDDDYSSSGRDDRRDRERERERGRRDRDRDRSRKYRDDDRHSSRHSSSHSSRHRDRERDRDRDRDSDRDSYRRRHDR